MNKMEIINLLNLIEQEFPVNDWIIDGIHIWPIIRIDINNKIAVNLASSAPKRSNVKLDSIKDGCNNNITWLDEKIDVVFLTDNMRKTYLTDYWYDRLCDPIIDELNKHEVKSLVLELQEDNYERWPRLTNHIPIKVFLEDAQSLLDRPYQHESELSKLDELSKFIYKKLDIAEIKEIFNFINIPYKYTRIRSKADFFKMVLLRTEAKIGCLVNYYGEDGLAFCLACNELGLPSVDIQHGIQGDYDYAYSRWSSVPSEGYGLLPSHFWCWGEQEEKLINNWGKDKHKALISGNPWLLMWKSSNSSLVKEYDNIIYNSKILGQVNLLVTLQPIYGLIGWRFNLPEWFLDVIKKSPANWKWFFRFHPQMMKGRFDHEAIKIKEKIIECNLVDKIEFELSTIYPLPALLRNMDLHITGSSTTVLEAEYFGVPSITMHENAILSFPGQIAIGSVVPAFTGEEFMEALKNKLKENGPNEPNDNTSLVDIYNLYKHTAKATTSKYSTVSNYELELQYFNALESGKEYVRIINIGKGTNDIIINIVVANAYVKLGNLEEAIMYYKKCIDDIKYGTKLRIRHIITLCEIHHKLDEVYKTKLESVLIHVANNFNLIGLLLKELFKRHLFQWVLFFSKWHQTTPGNIDVFFFESRTLILVERFPEAIEKMNKFVHLYKTSKSKFGFQICCDKGFLVSAYYYLGEAHLKLGEREEALDCFETCLKLNNDNHSNAEKYLKELKINSK